MVGEKNRVLYLDDNAALRQAVARRLRREFEVVEIETPEDALRAADEQRFDAVLTDFSMPVMDGRQFVERLAIRHPDLARRAVFHTGGAPDEAGREYLSRLPAERVVLKTAALVNVIRALRIAIGGREQ